MHQKKYSHIIIDLNNLYWRSVCSIIKNNLKNYTNINYPIIIQDSINRIKELKQKFGYEETKIFLLHDNPFSKINEREILYPLYKHKRKTENIPPIFYTTLDKLIEILKYYSNNYIISYCNGYEADDLTLPVQQYIYNQNKNSKILLVSVDLDWARCIDNNTDWYNYNNIYDIINFKEKYKFNPDIYKICMFKCIHGDESDCIPIAIPYLPTNILIYIINTYNTLDELLLNMWKDENIPQNWKLKIKEAEKQLKINWQLVNFTPLHTNIDDCLFFCKENIKMLRYFYSIYDLELENKMIDKDNEFFSRKKYKRIINTL